MKRLFGYLALILAMSFLTWAIIPATATTYHYLTQELFSSQMPNVPNNTKIVNICPSGCKYTTLNAACAAETSTSSSPIIYYVHAGVYSSATQQTCSGEDYATIMGDGPSSRIINTESGLNTDPNGEGAGDYGTIGMGTSTNWTIHDIYLKGHRTIYLDGNGTGSTDTGGGNVTVYNTVMETLGAQPNEDCMFLRDPASGTEYHLHDNVCTATTDGFTNISGATKWYVNNNTFFSTTDTGVGQTGGSYALQAIPSIFIDQGSTFNIGRSKSGSGVAINYAYWFNGGAAAGGDGTECTSGCYAVIQSPVVRLANTDSSGDGATNIAIKIESGATHLASLDIHSPDIKVTTTDSGAGSSYGLYLSNTTTAVRIVGGKIRTSGGATNQDITESSGTNLISVASLDYTNDGSKAAAMDQRRIRSSVESTFGTVNPSSSGAVVSVTSNDSPTGIRLENMDAVNSEQSPSVVLCNSVAAGTSCGGIAQFANGNLFVGDSGFTKGLEMRMDGAFSVLHNTALSVYTASIGGQLFLGDPAATTDTNNYIYFDTSGNDGQITWKASKKTLALTTGGGLQLDCQTTMPTCDANAKGLIVCDGDGTVGLCLCNGAAYVAFGGAADCS